MATEAISRRIIAIKHLNVPSEIQLSFISCEWFECCSRLVVVVLSVACGAPRWAAQKSVCVVASCLAVTDLVVHRHGVVWTAVPGVVSADPCSV